VIFVKKNLRNNKQKTAVAHKRPLFLEDIDKYLWVAFFTIYVSNSQINGQIIAPLAQLQEFFITKRKRLII